MTILGNAVRAFCGLLIFLAVSIPSLVIAKDTDALDDKEVSRTNEAAPSVTENAVGDLKRRLSEQREVLSEQQKQIEQLRLLLQEQRKLTGSTIAAKTPSEGKPAASAPPGTAPAVSAPAAAAPVPTPVKAQDQEIPRPSNLSFHIGSAYITPIGFMDFTSVRRSTAPGSGIGTNFGSIPFSNTTQGKLGEFRLSTQNSRIGCRIDAIVKGANVLAYWESDFLGFLPSNAAVSSNSDSMRLRLYWVDVRKNKWEVLGGQSWSLITPGRKGISPLPGDLFYSQDIDVNYQLGLTWSRDPQLRVVFHPNETIAAGLSLESPEQYVGGSAGGGAITLPGDLTAAYAPQLNNGGTTLAVPGVHPDIVAKIAFDPKLPANHALHFEIAGTARTFRVWNPLSARYFRASGAGAQANLSVELFKGFYALTNNYWSDGGGRWIFGQAPDLIVRSDGSLSPVHSASTVSGFEYTAKNTLLYAYYGGTYIGRNVTFDASNGKYVGYGYPGSPSSQNRLIQEGTFGFTHTFWKDAKYGALSLMGQYSYLVRNPWVAASGQPRAAKANMIFLNLRYALPGSAPKME